jgi:alkyldihydroxyacetonephosphate synthase
MKDGERIELSWAGWGDPARAAPVPPAIARLLEGGLGVTTPRPGPASIADVELVGARLPGHVLQALVAAVGSDHASGAHDQRARHALGRSTIDLLALRTRGPLWAPDLVLFPGSHDEILAVLELCSRDRVAVVPFGGGTSVVGGLAPDSEAFTGTVAVDLRRLDELIEFDATSRMATFGPGLRGPEAEALVGSRGYTIGHFPQSFEFATLGGFAAARSSGQASAGYGRFDELVQRLKVATPAGTLTLGRAPKSAAGPDLRQLILGSEGAFGVITELTVSVTPMPAQRIYEGWLLSDFDRGLEIVARLAQDGPTPTVLRLSDEAETALGLARPDQLGRSAGAGCLAIVGWEGSADDVGIRREAGVRMLRAAGATHVAGAGEQWAQGRFSAPYLRDALVDAGALVETLETATFWSSVRPLYDAVAAAVRESLTSQSTPPLILCHVSHTYRSGASLYFTVVCAQLPDPIEQWRRAKAAARKAIFAAGGSISHHHGVGRDHREGLTDEIGELGIGVLAAVKRTLDPAGILNPGILISA